MRVRGHKSEWLRACWLAELVEADARPGGVFRIFGPVGVSIEGTYLEVVPDRKVVFTWGGVEGVKPGQSTVEFLLERDDDGTPWSDCAITGSRKARSNPIVAVGSNPVWQNSRMQLKGGNRPISA
jgi:hypothetical protein